MRSGRPSLLQLLDQAMAPWFLAPLEMGAGSGDCATLCKPTPCFGDLAGNVAPTGRHPSMDASVHRRVTVAVCWALARRAALDSQELYEDSYALSEEFREWLVCLEDHPEELKANVLMLPRDLRTGRRPETDGLLEI